MIQRATQSLLESGKHPSELRDKVCSPSGPVIYGINALDKIDVAGSIQLASEAAYKRAEELARSDWKNFLFEKIQNSLIFKD